MGHSSISFLLGREFKINYSFFTFLENKLEGLKGGVIGGYKRIDIAVIDGNKIKYRGNWNWSVGLEGRPDLMYIRVI